METVVSNETTLIIPENTFSEAEWREIDHYARVLAVSREQLLAAAWRYYAEDIGERPAQQEQPVPRDEAWFV